MIKKNQEEEKRARFCGRGDEGMEEAEIAEQEAEEEMWEETLEIDDFEDMPARQTRFFTSVQPKEIFRILVNAFDGKYEEDLKCEYEISDQKWKMKLKVPDLEMKTCDIKLKLYKVNDEETCVDFMRLGASDHLKFVQFYQKLTSNPNVAPYNDV